MYDILPAGYLVLREGYHIVLYWVHKTTCCTVYRIFDSYTTSHNYILTNELDCLCLRRDVLFHILIQFNHLLFLWKTTLTTTARANIALAKVLIRLPLRSRCWRAEKVVYVVFI